MNRLFDLDLRSDPFSFASLPGTDNIQHFFRSLFFPDGPSGNQKDSEDHSGLHYGDA
jgi:hypothetical protein